MTRCNASSVPGQVVVFEGIVCVDGVALCHAIYITGYASPLIPFVKGLAHHSADCICMYHPPSMTGMVAIAVHGNDMRSRVASG